MHTLRYAKRSLGTCTYTVAIDSVYSYSCGGVAAVGALQLQERYSCRSVTAVEELQVHGRYSCREVTAVGELQLYRRDTAAGKCEVIND